MSSSLPFALQALWVGLAAIVAGLISALAGGGSLISFPALTAIRLPEVRANLNTTVALAPGYLGSTVAQRRERRDQQKLLWVLFRPAPPAAWWGGFCCCIAASGCSPSWCRS